MSEFSELTVYYPNWATYELDYQPSDIPVKDVSEIIYAFAQVGNCKVPCATDNNPGLCNSDGTYFTGTQDYRLYSTDPYSDFNHVPEDYPNDWDGRRGNIDNVLSLGKPVMLSVGGWSLSAPVIYSNG